MVTMSLLESDDKVVKSQPFTSRYFFHETDDLNDFLSHHFEPLAC